MVVRLTFKISASSFGNERKSGRAMAISLSLSNLAANIGEHFQALGKITNGLLIA